MSFGEIVYGCTDGRMTDNGSNPQPPGHRADALPLKHCAGIQTISMESKCPNETLCMSVMNLAPRL